MISKIIFNENKTFFFSFDKLVHLKKNNKAGNKSN